MSLHSIISSSSDISKSTYIPAFSTQSFMITTPGGNLTGPSVESEDNRKKALTTVIIVGVLVALLAIAWAAQGIRVSCNAARKRRTNSKRKRTSNIKKNENRLSKQQLLRQQSRDIQETKNLRGSKYSQTFEGEINRAFNMERNLNAKLFCQDRSLDLIEEESTVESVSSSKDDRLSSCITISSEEGAGAGDKTNQVSPGTSSGSAKSYVNTGFDDAPGTNRGTIIVRPDGTTQTEYIV